MSYLECEINNRSMMKLNIYPQNPHKPSNLISEEDNSVSIAIAQWQLTYSHSEYPTFNN